MFWRHVSLVEEYWVLRTDIAPRENREIIWILFHVETARTQRYLIGIMRTMRSVALQKVDKLY